MRTIRLAVVCLIGALSAACGGGEGDFTTEGGDTPPTVIGVGGPAAQLMVSRLSGHRSGVVRARGQGADPEGGPLTYEWDYESDGVIDSVGPEATIAISPRDRLHVQLIVTDDDGNASVATGVIEGVELFMAHNYEPLMVVRASTLIGEPDTEFYFHAPASLGAPYPTAEARSWDWDFEGDGVFDATTTVPFASHVYRTVGANWCRVVATDWDGRRDEASVTVTVCPDGTLPETAPGCMIASRLPGTTQNTSILNLTYNQKLTAFGGDADGGPVSISWDLDGDGRFDDGVGRHANMLVSDRGTYEVRMRMMDDEGRRSEAMCTLMGRMLSDGGVSPTAHTSVECDALTVTPGVPVHFMARCEQVGAGHFPVFEAVSWDFDGDGREDSTAHRAAFTFTTPGTYKPEVRVIRADGSDVRSYVTVVVEKCGLPHDPAFWCRCEDRAILHGGVAKPVIECGPLDEPHPVPALAGVISARGRGGPLVDGSDPRGLVLSVRDHDGVMLADPPQPARVPAGYPLVLTTVSTAVDGPTRVIPYDVTVRLEDPGVRVQILKCLVRVIHVGFDTSFNTSGVAPNHTGEVVIVPLPDPGPDVPGVAAAEIIFGEQAPSWFKVNEVLDVPLGWSATIDPTRILVALSQPANGGALVSGSDPLKFTVDFETTDAQNPPTQCRIRLYDAVGELIGIEEMKVIHTQ